MTEKMLTVRLSEQEHRALKLYAVLQGRSVNAVVLELIRAELTKNAPTADGRSREQFVADLFDRLGIDPASPEHQAAATRADASIQYSTADRTTGGKDGKGERGPA
jgi:plasmid stability protein